MWFTSPAWQRHGNEDVHSLAFFLISYIGIACLFAVLALRIITCQVSTYLWEPMCALVLFGGFCFSTASASRVLQPCQVSWLGNTILEVIGVCTNLRFWFLTETSTLSRDLEGRKLPGGFPGVVEVPLAALRSSQAQSFVSDIWIATADPPCIVYRSFGEGRKRQVCFRLANDQIAAKGYILHHE